MTNTLDLIGMMSGTSCDGMDLAWCRFWLENNHWEFRILAAETFPYDKKWETLLKESPQLETTRMLALHACYGRYMGQRIALFKERHSIPWETPAACHGHTVFHQPEKGFSFQLGHGASIAAFSGATAINDFRSMDVALGGQGAPLVPIGDELLFSHFEICLNLGGFANISYQQQEKRKAYDICPLNFVINRLVRQARISTKNFFKRADHQSSLLTYDPEGQIARSGKPIAALMDQMDRLPFYSSRGPKSLGEEWVREHFWPLIDKFSHQPPEDILHTFYLHAARQISSQIPYETPHRMLITGGGAYNTFFLEQLNAFLPGQTSMVVPEKELIEYKEALIFAFLGLKCLRGEINCLASATGASRNSISGSIHFARKTSD